MNFRPQCITALSRREILALGGSALASMAVAYDGLAAAPIRTSARIVIVGGGAAGLAIASRLSRMLDGAQITIVESRREHRFQPGFTLVYAGVWRHSSGRKRLLEREEVSPREPFRSRRA